MFQCDCCGCCCRNLNKSDIYKELNRGDGVCKYLSGNLCSIYEERPLICRVDECYELFFKQEMSVIEYYNINSMMCMQLKEKEREEICHYH